MPSSPSLPARTAKPHILLLTPDIEGPVRNGGIGTAFTALASALVATGHDVTIFYTLGDYAEQGSIAHWTAHYASQGIRFLARPQPSGPALTVPYPRANAWQTFEWLRDFPETFDLIYCPEWRGDAYYALLARRMGLHFQKTPFVTVTHSPSVWSQEGNFRLPTSVEDLETEFLEEQCIALADHLISPSHYMFSWLDRRNWPMPAHRTMLQNCIPPNLITKLEAPALASPAPIREIVFFGRLEERKGLTLLIKALDRLSPTVWQNIEQLTFLGKASDDASCQMLFQKRDAMAWPARIQIKTELDRTQANAYLAGPGRLAVMASLSDNSPYSVVECLCQKSPFIASAVGGIPELVAPEDRARILFEPNPQALAECLTRILTAETSPAPAAMAFSPQDLPGRWADLTRDLLQTPEIAALSKSDAPHITVCLTHHERPAFLREALKSLSRQTYVNFDVVIIDDGSIEPETLAFLDSLAPDLERRGWTLVRGTNRYPGAARNLGARHARGDYLMFMDDDNIALPHELDVFVRAARQTNADILTCAFDVYQKPISADKPGKPPERWIPLGGAPSVGAFQNCFGDANALIRRNFFEKIGGFTEDYGIGHEDWEFFAIAMKHNPRFFVVPQALFLYRSSPKGVQRSSDILRSHSRSVRPFAQKATLSGGSGLAYALHLHLQVRPVSYAPRNLGITHSLRVMLEIVKVALGSRLLREKFRTSLRQRGIRRTLEIVWRYTFHKVIKKH